MTEEHKKKISIAQKERYKNTNAREKLRQANLGKNMPKNVKEEISLKLKNIRKSENNPMWKGDKVGYAALHEWVKKHLIKPQNCRDCNQPKPLDLANISQEYKRELSDWEWLCRSCHMKKDGRMERLHRKGKIPWNKGLTRKIDKRINNQWGFKK